MNVNSNKSTRDRQKWHEGRKQTSEKGAAREDKCWWGGWGGGEWGQSNLFKDVQFRSTCLQVPIVLIFFQLFLDERHLKQQQLPFGHVLLLT